MVLDGTLRLPNFYGTPWYYMVSETYTGAQWYPVVLSGTTKNGTFWYAAVLVLVLSSTK